MSQVVINDIPPRTQAYASGGQTVYGTTWTANAASDVVVYSRATGVEANDATQILAYPAQYSVSFVGALLQVQVTLVNPSTLGDVVTITRMTPADRENLYSNTNFVPSMLNNDFGILTLVDQQAQLVNQSIGPRYNYSAIITPIVDTILPILAPNETWQMNSAGTGIEAVIISSGSGTITEIDTGLGLTGGPITSTGTISFGAMAANSFWGNITGSSAVPTEVTTGYFLKTANNLSDVPSKSIARTNLGLEIGVNVEAWSAALDSIAGLTTSANQLIYTTASDTYAVLSAIANSVLIAGAGSIPVFAATLPSAVQSNITRLGAQAIALNMNSHQINNVTDPTNPQDAATMAYVISQTTGAFLPLIGGTMSGIINMGNNKITSMADPSASQDAVTLSYMNTQLALKLSLSGGTMTGAINMGSHFITNLLDPVNPQDAATKNYVDTVATGLTIQPACAVATTANLNGTYLNGASGIGATLTNAGALTALVIDGYTVATNDRILVKNQSSTFQNGIYVATNVGSGAVAWILTRATDYDQPAEITPGDLIIINNGTTNAGASFIETASVSIIGTDPILFSQFTFSATAVLLKANNLSDVANTTTSFNNISPLTTKGDLIGYSSQNVRLAVGMTDGQILQVSSGAATGLAWSTATYPVTTTVNQLLYSSATNTVVGLATIAGGVLVTDASGVPSMLTNPAVAGKILQSANAAIPAWSTPTYPSASGTSGKFLISDGTNNVYSTSTIPTSAGATANKLLLSNGTNYVLSTPTFPNASATANKIIKSDGTNWIASTETYAAPGTSGNVMTSDGTNWISSAPIGSGTVNSGTAQQLAYYATTGTAVSGLTTSANAVLTSAAGTLTWANQLALTLGGTNASLTASNGGIFYSTASAGAILAGTATAGLALLSGASTTPTWSTSPPITQVNVQTITATGAFTYTPTTGTKYAIFELQGGGGGSGGTTGTAGQGATGGGGASGNYLKLIVSGSTNLAAVTGSVGIAGTAGSSGNNAGGTGGSTTLTVNGGTQWVAGGGGGGGGQAASAAAQNSGTLGAVNANTTGTNGTLIISILGQQPTIGFSGAAASITPIITSRGGDSFFGFGAGSTAANGLTGTGYGAGATGGLNVSAANQTGSAGTQGIVLITEFISI